MDKELNIDFEVLKDEIYLYLLGLMSKEELLMVVNQKRATYGFDEIDNLPEEFERLLSVSKKAIDSGLDFMDSQI